ncbi:hypothetical protein [Tunturiibacter lichenicola]|uniref:hypothetical protein n=1 Tax=Tunturiibacter lichenicola TaxID=2051959 RepID=UPI003D9B93E8
MNTLDDASVINIIDTIAQERLRAAVPEVAFTADLRAALAEAFNERPAASVSAGDVARAALDVLTEEPAFAEPVRMMTENTMAGGPGAQRYLEPSSIALATAALLVLQLRVKFKRDHTGKWLFEMDKKASGDGPVRLLVQRLLAYLP